MPKLRRSSKKFRSLEEIEKIVSDFHASGLSLGAFARSRRIPLSTLSHWIRREKKKEDPTPSVVPVHVIDTKRTAQDGFEIVLTNGRVIRIAGEFDAEALVRVLAAAETRC